MRIWSRKTLLLFLVMSVVIGTASCVSTQEKSESESASQVSESVANDETTGLTGLEEEAVGTAIVWEDTVLEALVRQGLEKPDGDIYPSDLAEIRSLCIWGNGLIYIDDEVMTNATAIEDLVLRCKSLLGQSLDLEGLDQGISEKIIEAHFWRAGENGRIKKLTDLVHFPSLEVLVLSRQSISEVSGVQDLENLRVLDLSYNTIVGVDGLSNLSKLENLSLVGNRLLLYEPLSSLVNLRELTVESPLIEDVDFLSPLAKMQYLGITGTYLTDLQGLSTMENLLFLDITAGKLTSADALGGLTNLQELRMNCMMLENIEGFSSLTNLEKLSFSTNQKLDLQPLSGLLKLQDLTVFIACGKPGGPVDLTPLAGLSELTNLYLLDMGLEKGYEDVLANLPNLRTLGFGTPDEKLDFLVRLENLEFLYLTLYGYSAPPDLHPISQMTNLKHLDLLSDSIDDIGPIASLENLNSLILSCSELTDLTPLAGLVNLEELYLQEMYDISDAQVVGELSNLKTLYISSLNADDFHFLEKLLNLQELLIGTRGESSFIWQDILELPNLQMVQIDDKTLEMDEDVFAALSGLRYVRVNGKVISEVD